MHEEKEQAGHNNGSLFVSRFLKVYITLRFHSLSFHLLHSLTPFLLPLIPIIVHILIQYRMVLHFHQLFSLSLSLSLFLFLSVSFSLSLSHSVCFSCIFSLFFSLSPSCLLSF